MASNVMDWWRRIAIAFFPGGRYCRPPGFGGCWFLLRLRSRFLRRSVVNAIVDVTLAVDVSKKMLVFRKIEDSHSWTLTCFFDFCCWWWWAWSLSLSWPWIQKQVAHLCAGWTCCNGRGGRRLQASLLRRWEVRGFVLLFGKWYLDGTACLDVPRTRKHMVTTKQQPQ